MIEPKIKEITLSITCDGCDHTYEKTTTDIKESNSHGLLIYVEIVCPKCGKLNYVPIYCIGT